VKVLRYVLVSLAALLGIAGLLAWWILGDDDWLRDTLERQVSAATGRQFEIMDGFAVDWSATPVVHAAGIRLANPTWAARPDLAQIDSLDVTFSLFSLLSGRPRVDLVRIAGVTVWLERNSAGEATWALGSPGAAPPAKPAAGLSFSLGSLEISKATVTMTEAGHDKPMELQLDEVQLSEGPDQGLDASLQGRMGELPLGASGHIAPLSGLLSQGAWQHEIRLELGKTLLTSRGRMTRGLELAGANLEMQFSGPEIARVLATLSVPPIATGPFELNLGVNTDAALTNVDLKGDLGDLQLAAQVQLETAGGLLLRSVKGSADGPNLAAVAELFGVPCRVAGPFELQADLSREQATTEVHKLTLASEGNRLDLAGRVGEWPALAGSELELTFSGPNLGLWLPPRQAEYPVTPFDLTGNLAQTVVGTTRLQVRLKMPDSTVELKGDLGKLPGMVGADVTLTATGPGDGSLVKLLQLPSLTGGTEKVQTQLQRDASFIHFRQFQVDFAGNHLDLTGRLGNWPELHDTQLAVNGRGGDFGAVAALAGLEGLPRTPYSFSTRLASAKAGLKVSDTEFSVAGMHAKLEGLVTDQANRRGSRLQLDLTGDDLAKLSTLPGLRGAPSAPFSLAGAVSVGKEGLRVEGGTAGIGASRFEASGIVGLGPGMPGTDLSLRFTSPDLSDLGALLGGLAAPAARVRLDGRLLKEGDGWSYDIASGEVDQSKITSTGQFGLRYGRFQLDSRFQAGGPDLAAVGKLAGLGKLPALPFETSGTIGVHDGWITASDLQARLDRNELQLSGKVNLADHFAGSELRFHASGPDLGSLLPPGRLDQALPFELGGRLAREDGATVFDRIEAKAGKFVAQVNGRVGKLQNLSATDLNLDISAPTAQNLGRLLGLRLPDQALQIKGRFTGEPRIFLARGLEIRMGESEARADLQVNLADKPRLSGNLNAPLLDLTWLAPPEPVKGKDKKPAKRPKPADGRLIPDKPLPRLPLDPLDTDLHVHVDRLRLKRAELQQIDARLLAQDGVLTVDPFESHPASGGQIQGSFTADYREPVTSYGLSLHGQDLLLGENLGLDVPGAVPPDKQQKAELTAKLNTSGLTVREAAANLDGRLLIDVGPGLASNRGLNVVFGDFIGELLNLLNPFAKSQEFIAHDCEVIAARAESGVIKLDPVVSVSDKIAIVANGVVDLNNEKLDVTFNTSPRKGIGLSAGMVINPFVKLSGTLASPSIGLDPEGVVVQGGLAVATAGISLLAKSFLDRVQASPQLCTEALKKAGQP